MIKICKEIIHYNYDHQIKVPYEVERILMNKNYTIREFKIVNLDKYNENTGSRLMFFVVYNDGE